MQFYLLIDGKKSGPFTAYALHGMVKDGSVTEETVAWHAGLDAWKPMGEVPALESYFKAPEIPKETETDTKPESDIPYTAAAQAARRGTTAPVARIVHNVRPWRRAVARLVDTQLFYITVSLAQFKMGHIDNAHFYQPTMLDLLSIYAMWIVVESLLLSSIGTTPGKALLSLRIFTEEGEKLSFGRALKRSVLVWWRGFGIGFLPLQIFVGVLSYLNLTQSGTTVWDASVKTRVGHGTMQFPRIILLVLIFISLGHLLYNVVGEPPFVLLPPRNSGATPLIPES